MLNSIGLVFIISVNICGSVRLLAIVSHSRISHQTLKESSFNPQISKLVPESDENSNKPLFFGNRGLDIDLNLDFSSPPHTADSGGGGVDTAHVSMAEKSSVGECDLKEEVNGCDSSANKDDEEEEEEESVVEERGTEFSEVINTRSQSSEIDHNGVAEDTTMIKPNNNNPLPELRSDHDFLHLLIEAAKLISGDFIDSRAYGSASATQLQYDYDYEEYLDDSEGSIPGRGVQWVIMGDPLAKKQVYAERLSKLLRVPHISMGSLVRQEPHPQSSLYKQISNAVNQRIGAQINTLFICDSGAAPMSAFSES